MTFSFFSGEDWRLRLYLILHYLTINEFAHTVFKMSNGVWSMPWCRPTITDAPLQWRTIAYRGLARRLANYPIPRTNPRMLPSHYTHLAPRILPSPEIWRYRCWFDSEWQWQRQRVRSLDDSIPSLQLLLHPKLRHLVTENNLHRW